MFTFLHAADLHLDSPLKGLEQYEGAPIERIRNAARRAMENLIELAIDQEVDFVVISGDLYDGNWPDYGTGLYFVQQMVRLHRANIPVFLISGNHDAANKMTRSLRLPDNVTFFASKSPETAELENLKVAVHGQSFDKAAIREDLSLNYPGHQEGYYNIGLLHTCGPEGGREGHDPYAPCTLPGLKNKGYNYWALGHIHTRHTLSEEPYVVFPGNIQGRHIRETGPKGCYLVRVDDQHQSTLEFHPLDVLRWERCAVDLTDCTESEEIYDRISEALEKQLSASDERTLALRVEVSGKTILHDQIQSRSAHWTNEIRNLGLQAGADLIWVEKVLLRTSSPTEHVEDEDFSGALQELHHLTRSVKQDPDSLAEKYLALDDLLRKLPSEILEDLAIEDPQWQQQVLTQAESRLSELLRHDQGAM